MEIGNQSKTETDTKKMDGTNVRNKYKTIQVMKALMRLEVEKMGVGLRLLLRSLQRQMWNRKKENIKIGNFIYFINY